MNNNIFNLTFDYIPPIGDDIERKLGGENIKKTLKEYKRFLEVQYRKENTQKRYLDSAEKLHKFVSEISQEEIQRYITHLNRYNTPNTIASCIQGMNLYLDFLELKHLRVSTPGWKPVHRDVITLDEIKKLREYVKEHYPFMDYLIILFITELDCRPHEIIRAKWSWIKGNKIYFQDCKTGDTTGRLTPELKQALEHWKQIKPYTDNKHIFCNIKGRYANQPIKKHGWHIRKLIQRTTKKVIGRAINPQDLRASVITEEYNHFVNPKIIQLKARHRSFKTTMRYNHVDEKMLDTYVTNGTIFSNDNRPISRLNNIDNGGYIKGLPSSTSSTLIDETEDNSTFSFSFSFFQAYFINTIWDWGFCLPNFDHIPTSIQRLLPTSHITSLGVTA